MVEAMDNWDFNRKNDGFSGIGVGGLEGTLSGQEALPGAAADEGRADEGRWLEAGKAWLAANTSVRISEDGALPGAVALFLEKYREIVERAGVRDEALGGMRLGYAPGTAEQALRELAAALLPGYCDAVRFMPAGRRWG